MKTKAIENYFIFDCENKREKKWSIKWPPFCVGGLIYACIYFRCAVFNGMQLDTHISGLLVVSLTFDSLSFSKTFSFFLCLHFHLTFKL